MKLVTVDIDQLTAEVSIDLTGYKGKGCSKVIEEFAKLGKQKKVIKKPEYNQVTGNAQTK